MQPRKMSIYREEAMDVLISCLGDSDFPTAQISAAEAIMSLQGRFSTSGRPLARYFLLERAGHTKGHQKRVNTDDNSSASGEVSLTRVSFLKKLDIFSVLGSLLLVYKLSFHNFDVLSYSIIQKLTSFP